MRASAPTLFLSAGDTSGDLHAASLIRELLSLRPDLRIVGVGGEAMAEAGASLLYPLAKNPIMGFRRVIHSLGHFVKLLSELDRRLGTLRPDLVVPIDFPGFNLNLAAIAKARGLKTCYYICPQYWGWAPWRVKRFRQVIDRALVIFPFEVGFFAEHGVFARYVGHPVADRLAALPHSGTSSDGNRVALLPGSRGHEIKQHFRWMLQVGRRLDERSPEALEFCTTHPNPRTRETLAREATTFGLKLRVLDADLPAVLQTSRFALLSSGTATLEAALIGVPSVVLYRVSRLLEWGSRFLLNCPYIAQPNLLAGNEVFPEFLQSQDPTAALTTTCEQLLRNSPHRTRCLFELHHLRARHFRPGAAKRAAAAVLELLPRQD